ncbi:hypothetical protein F511_21292 [Dorcoceras hygrometricum]|uniref:Uncharacterized protein n=1 Tax=Dorcoceras hygrometricum TaxID=472368 RepID=A0A2Z7CGA1_9LAMI|nr:hypothetical protein F511_21292 [Dorcoceras hygrometricum]
MLTQKLKPAEEPTNSLYEDTTTYYFFSNIDSGLQMGSNRKATHNESNATKITQIIGGERRLSTEYKSWRTVAIRGFGKRDKKYRQQPPVDTFSKEHQNDTVPTNLNGVAELHQLTTDISCETTKSCVSTYSNDVASHHSRICAPAASNNHSKRNYCQQITTRHAYVISTDSKSTS